MGLQQRRKVVAMKISKVQDTVFTKGNSVHEMVGRSIETGNTKYHNIVHVLMPSRHSGGSHYHKSAEETYYILKGEADIVIDGYSFKATPGMIVSILPGEIHDVINNTDSDFELLAISAPAFSPEDSIDCEMPLKKD